MRTVCTEIHGPQRMNPDEVSGFEAKSLNNNWIDCHEKYVQTSMLPSG